MRPEFEAWILDQIERQRRGEQISEYLSPTFLKSLSRLVEHNVFGGEMNTIDRAAQDLETTASRIREECRRLTLLARRKPRTSARSHSEFSKRQNSSR